jgi:hypothetical protein
MPDSPCIALTPMAARSIRVHKVRHKWIGKPGGGTLRYNNTTGPRSDRPIKLSAPRAVIGNEEPGGGTAPMISRTMMTMTAEEALLFGVPQTHRKNYYRIDTEGGPVPPEPAKWFRRVYVKIDAGEPVEVSERWYPPTTL